MLHLGLVDYLENNVSTCNWVRFDLKDMRYNLTTNIMESVIH